MRLYALIKCGSPLSAGFVPYNLLPKSHIVQAFVIVVTPCGVGATVQIVEFLDESRYEF